MSLPYKEPCKGRLYGDGFLGVKLLGKMGVRLVDLQGAVSGIPDVQTV